ncbi:MAG TPA: extracellular solute-binding protein [Clostridiales bacterium]|nr:extracellular solute-binding protein [Clostridiales bacterium]
MKKLKTVLSFLLVTIMVCTVVFAFAGCKVDEKPSGSGSSTDPPSGKSEPKEVKWMLYAYGTVKLESHLKIYQKLEELANVKIVPIPVPSDVYKERFNITVISDDVPDIVSVRSVGKTANELGEKGIFVALNNHYDKLPNFKKYIDKFADSVPHMTANDNNVYSFPLVRDNAPIPAHGIVLREDLLTKQGIDINSIETVEDLYKAFAALKDANDGKPVIGARNGLENLNLIAQTFGTRFMIPRYDKELKKYISPVDDPNLKSAVEYCAKLYKDGILHPDWASMSDEIWEQSVASGELLVFFDNMQQIAQRNADLRVDNPDAKLAAILPPKYNGIRYEWGGSAKLDNNRGTAISSKTKALDEALMINDWLFSDEGVEFVVFGEEGKTFRRRDDGTNEYIVDSDWETGTGPLPTEYGSGQNVNFLRVMDESLFNDWHIYGKNKNEMEPYCKVYAEQIYTYILPPQKFNQEQVEKLKELQTPLDTAFQENLVLFINNSKSMDEWDNFMQTLKDMRIDELVALYNETLE